jgi:GNAT superfamily N-acetyltransferase
VEIRDARAGEVAALEALQRRAAMVWEDYRADLEAHPDAIELAPAFVRDGLVRVAVDAAGRRLGFSVLLAPAGGARELDCLFVEPDAWRRGVGTALIADAVSRAAGTALEVTANPRALDFYAAVGFVACGTASTRFGPAPRLRREPG